MMRPSIHAEKNPKPIPSAPTVSGNQARVTSPGSGTRISNSSETIGQSTAETAQMTPRRCSVTAIVPSRLEG